MDPDTKDKKTRTSKTVTKDRWGNTIVKTSTVTRTGGVRTGGKRTYKGTKSFVETRSEWKSAANTQRMRNAQMQQSKTEMIEGGGDASMEGGEFK